MYYSTSFTPAWQKNPDYPAFGARRIISAASPTRVLEPIDLEIQSIIDSGILLNPNNPIWTTPRVNRIHPRIGISALAAAIYKGNGEIINKLLASPDINLNLLYPVSKAPEQVWARLKLRFNKDFLDGLPSRGDERYYTALDLIQLLGGEPGNGIWVSAFKPFPRVSYPSLSRKRNEINKTIEVLKARGALRAVEIIPPVN